ncbi:DUF317 domain-containing protein [Streptomyces sp. NBC_01613]|uniref:DUF317 domain-containing protein n=1 Tax=Streptomyces sp. NBC_01613 TaxID=2975896 RepID=UPI00386AB8FA
MQDPTIWRAVFTGTTPLHLIAAVTQSLASDPSRIPGLARVRMTVRIRHVAAPDIALALERRVSALAARHRPATAAPPAPHGRSPRHTRVALLTSRTWNSPCPSPPPRPPTATT